MTNKRIQKKRRSLPQAGFTIIETLMAVLVLSIAMAGSLALAAKGLGLIQVARQEVSAVYLAQDAMEYIKGVRDTNCLVGNSLLTNCTTTTWLGAARSLGTRCGDSAGCQIDTLTGDVSVCPAAGCAALNYDATGAFYTYSGVSSVPTAFVRSVYIQTPVGGNADEASTTVLVQWSGQGGVTRSVRIHDDLYNWQ